MASGVTARVEVELEGIGVIGWVMWDMFGPESEVDGVLIPDQFFLRFPGGGDQPSLRVDFVVRSSQVICAGVHLDAKAEGREINSSDVEFVRRQLGELTRTATTSVMQYERKDESSGRQKRGLVGHDDATDAYRTLSQKPKRRKITTNHLRKVASLYTENIDGKPWAAIAEHFDVSSATAGRYVVQARKAGLLPATESGRKKA